MNTKSNKDMIKNTLEGAVTPGNVSHNELIAVSRKPTHPGEILREEFMPDYGLSVASLAQRLSVSRQSVNELVREKRGVSPDMAWRLARVFGTTPQYWSNMQRNMDLWEAFEGHSSDFDEIDPLPVPAIAAG